MVSSECCLSSPEHSARGQDVERVPDYPLVRDLETTEVSTKFSTANGQAFHDRFLDEMRITIDGQMNSLAMRLEKVMQMNSELVLDQLRSNFATNLEALGNDNSKDVDNAAWEKPEKDAYLEHLHDMLSSKSGLDNPQQRESQAKWRAMQLNHIGKKFELNSSGSSHLLKPLEEFFEKRRQAIPHNRLTRFCQGRIFTMACTVLIFSNTLFMGIEADVDMRLALGSAQTSGLSFRIVNRCFAGLFLLEVVIRIAAFRWHWLLAPDWKWNVFDALLVTTAIIQEVLENSNLSFMRIIRGFRVVRVTRVVRIVHFFRELRRMVIAISSCFASLCWAGLLLLLIMFIFSIVILEGASNFVREAADDDMSTTAKEGIALWYSTLGHTMFTLILTITGGMDWWEMLHPLLQVSEIYRYVFTFYVVFILVGVLNVLTAVFLENATELKDKDLVIQAQIMRNDAFAMEMRDFFYDLDEECSGFIEWERFNEVMHHKEIQAYLASQLLEPQDAYTLFKLIDSDGDGRIALEPFVQGCSRLRGNARTMDVAVLLREQAQLKAQFVKLRACLVEALARDQRLPVPRTGR